MHRKCFLLILPLLLSFSGEAPASQACAATVSELGTLLGVQALPLKWKETTMDDGKPLVLSIVESNGSLSLEFTKTEEGLWAESPVVVCKSGTGFEARFSGQQIHLGSAANWILRYALKNGGKFTLTKLGAEQLRVATSSWSGVFSPTAK